MNIEVDPNVHKLLMNIANRLSVNADLMMEPVKDLPIHEAALTPNYAIATSIKDVANVIKQALAP